VTASFVVTNDGKHNVNWHMLSFICYARNTWDVNNVESCFFIQSRTTQSYNVFIISCPETKQRFVVHKINIGTFALAEDAFDESHIW